jgi:hypothetical protein
MFCRLHKAYCYFMKERGGLGTEINIIRILTLLNKYWEK